MTRAFRRWWRAGRGGLKLLHDAIFPRAALERKARHLVNAHLVLLAGDRRVLDLCLDETGSAVDLAFGVAPSRRRARRLELSESALQSTISKLVSGGQMVVAVPLDLVEPWYELLSRHFLGVVRDRIVQSDDGLGVQFEPDETTSSNELVCEMLTATGALRHLSSGPRRLHVGAGSQRLEGWINVDIRPFKGVDLVADVTKGLGLTDIETVFAEHFLEHLAVDDALDFLAEVQSMLIAGGRLRLSTPNLEWVWRTHCLDVPAGSEVDAAVAINRAFYGWEHKFLWNREVLELVLVATGFRDLTWHRHGESDVDHLRELERHETYDESEDLPHVLIDEEDKGKPDPEGLAALREKFKRELLDPVAGF